MSFRWLSASNRVRYKRELLEQVKQFMKAASQFPGNHHGLAKVERQYAKLFKQK